MSWEKKVHKGQEGKLWVFTHTTDTNTNGVRSVWSSLEHYGDLEKNPIQHLRLLLDTTTFLKSYLTVEKPIKKGRKKWVHQCLLVRERGMGRNSHYCSNVFGSRVLNHFNFSAYEERRKHQKSFVWFLQSKIELTSVAFRNRMSGILKSFSLKFKIHFLFKVDDEPCTKSQFLSSCFGLAKGLSEHSFYGFFFLLYRYSYARDIDMFPSIIHSNPCAHIHMIHWMLYLLIFPGHRNSGTLYISLWWGKEEIFLMHS